MTIIEQIVQVRYWRRLLAGGVPLKPAKRTADQEITASLEFWAAKSEVALDAGTLDQAALEVK